MRKTLTTLAGYTSNHLLVLTFRESLTKVEKLHKEKMRIFDALRMPILTAFVDTRKNLVASKNVISLLERVIVLS